MTARTAKGPKKPPYIIRRLIEQLQRVLDGKRGRLPMLDAVPTYGRGCAKARQRDMRGERAEACILVLKYLARWVSETSRIVYHPPDKGIIGIRLVDLVAETGLCERRVDRAIRDLKAAGYLLTWERCEYDRETDQYKGIAAVRQFTHKLIEHLGLASLWAQCAKDRGDKERRKKLAQAQRAAPTLDALRARLAAGANAVRVAAQAVGISQALPSAFRPPG